MFAIVASLLANQANAASNLLFNPMDPVDIFDNFEFDSDSGQADLANWAANDGTKNIGWVTNAGNFEVVDNGGDGFVQRLSGSAGNVIAHLPYIYGPERTDVNSVYAEVSLPEAGAGNNNSVSIGFTNGETGANSFASSASGVGAADLWLELSRDGASDTTAIASVFWRVGLDNQLLGSLSGIDISGNAHVELELAYNQSSNKVAARVGGTDLFTGTALAGDPTDLSTWTASLPENWQIDMTGYGIEMDGGIGGAIYAFEAVPEPSSLLMLTLASLMSGIVLQRRRNG
jgi:hypothetical protein